MATKKSLAGSVLLLIILVSLAKVNQAQTQPLPFALSSGNFQFSYWDSLSAAGTYPEHMVFQFVPSNHLAPFYDDSATDYSCAYNLSKRPRINGYRGKGIGLVSTSNSQYNDCNSGTAEQKFMGSVVLALDASGRHNLRVQWKSETLVPGDGNGIPSNPRVWRLRLQYRIGGTGNFTDVPGPVEFVSGLNAGDSIVLGPTLLPAVCNNAALVQLRWIYYESSAGNAGTRPRLRLDDIVVSSEGSVGMTEWPVQNLRVYPNPAVSDFTLHCPTVQSGLLMIRNEHGQCIQEVPLVDGTLKLDCSNLPRGLYFLQVIDPLRPELHTAKLILR